MKASKRFSAYWWDEMLALIYIFWKRLLLSKKTVFFAFLAFAASLLAFVQSFSDLTPKEFFQQFLAPVFLSSMGVFIPMYFSTRSFSEEIDGRTIAYLLTRPISRGKLLLAKYFATVAASLSILLPAILFSAFLLSGSETARVWPQVPKMALLLMAAAMVYSAVFICFGVIFKRPIVFGVGVTFGWENLVSFIPGSFKDLAIMSYLRAMLMRSFDLERIFDTPVPDEIYSWTLSISVIASVTALGLFVGWLFLRKKEFV